MTLVEHQSPSQSAWKGNVPDSNDKLMIFVISGNNTSMQSITKGVGMGSRLQPFFLQPLTSFRTFFFRKCGEIV